jgi:hypothetical protein
MNDRTRNTERTVMSDSTAIRTWGEERGAVPVYYADEDRYELVHRDETTDDHRTHTWDEFAEKFTDHDTVLVYSENDEGRTTGGLQSAQFVDREDALTQATLDQEEVQEALLEGETVTTEFEEEIVVEKRVTERETIESELVASEEVDRRVVDRDLVERHIVDVDVGHIDIRSELVGDDIAGRDSDDRTEIRDDAIDRDSDDRTEIRDDAIDRDSDDRTEIRDDHSIENDTIDVEIEETWRVTEDILDRMTIESRVVDDTISDDETVTSDSTETSIDVEGVHRSLASQGFLGADVDADVLVDGDAIQSEVFEDEEGEIVRSQLFQRRTAESDVIERKTLTYDLTETVEESEETTVTTEREAEIVDIAVESDQYGDYDYDLSDETIERGRSGADTTAARTTNPAAGTDTTGTPTDSASTDAAGLGVEPSDQGKTVVDRNGNEVGVVDDVDEESDRLYVEPDPGMFDKVKAQLGWGSRDDDDHVITPDQIAGRERSQIVVQDA